MSLKTTTRQVLEAIKKNERGSYREWRDACGLSSTSVVRYHIRLLESAGLVKRKPGIARSVEIVKEQSHVA